MKVLILMTEKNAEFKVLKEAFNDQGFKVGYSNIKRVSLFSRTLKTEIRHPKIDVASYDAVYLTPELQLKQFIEPLLLELQDLGIYVQFKPNAFYINDNATLQQLVLNSAALDLPGSLLINRPRKLGPATRTMKYPLLLKIFKQQRKLFSLLVESSRSMNSLGKSLDTTVDGIFAKEFIEGDIEHCLVIGGQVYVIKREWQRTRVMPSTRAKMTKLSLKQVQRARDALNIVGADIGTVKLCAGKVVSVDLAPRLNLFNKKIGSDIYAEVAKLYAQKVNEMNKVHQ